MIASRQWSVDAAPAHQLGAPSYVGVFAVDEEIGVEELAIERNVLDHLAAVKRRGCRRAEDILVLQIVSVVHFLTAAVEMPQHRIEVNPGGIDQGPRGDIESCGHGQQLTADRADLGIYLAR